jgi:hypothetical protein
MEKGGLREGFNIWAEIKAFNSRAEAVSPYIQVEESIMYMTIKFRLLSE